MKSNILNQELKKIKDSESWCRKSPQRGDHIRIKDTLFYHHALYISNNEVIHFTYGKRGIMGNEGILESTSLKKFSRSNIPEVRIYSDHEKKTPLPR